MDTTGLYVAFSYTKGIGPTKFNFLIDRYGDIEKAFAASLFDLTNLIGPAYAQGFERLRNTLNLGNELRRLKEKGITVITRADRRYPKNLLALSDAPICLYVKGDPNCIKLNKQVCFAVVGTRAPTSYGERATKEFSFALAEKGLVIVSGMAIGIDGFAHTAAMDAGGKTVAVLGCGVDIAYPTENEKIYTRIVKGGGMVVSEFPPGHFVMKGLFVARNRVISGLCKGVLIVEGKRTSGAVHTAHYALDQGREVFAVPGSIYSQNSEAPNGLIAEGATPVFSPEDIAFEYGYKTYKCISPNFLKNLPPEELIICNELLKEPRSADELIGIAKIPIYQILSTLSSLEIKGVVEKNREGKYEVR